jgi:AAA15 family ATPase/GTPase
MIRQIKFNNFYSFKGEHTLNFVTNKKKSDNYFNTFDGKQITKVAIVVGPNNSGKTNLMKLLGFLDYFISTSTRPAGDEDFGVGFKAYAFCDQQPSVFEIEFETEEKLYFYKLKATQDSVVEESISARDLVKNSRVYKIFDRKEDSIVLNNKVLPGVTKKSLEHIKSNVSAIAFLNSTYDFAEIQGISEYFLGFRTNINEQGDVQSLIKSIQLAANAYDVFPDMKEKMEGLISEFDLGIKKFKFTKDKVNKSLEVEAVHQIDKKDFRMSLSYESRGTQALFAGIFDILASIEEGEVLALDEIENGLHPQAVTKLVRYIIDDFSERKRQFIFSSHSFEIMRRLDAQQMIFVEKENNESTLFRLDEVSVRPDENFLSKYMSGAYGAFPKIRI